MYFKTAIALLVVLLPNFLFSCTPVNYDEFHENVPGKYKKNRSGNNQNSYQEAPPAPSYNNGGYYSAPPPNYRPYPQQYQRVPGSRYYSNPYDIPAAPYYPQQYDTDQYYVPPTSYQSNERPTSYANPFR